MGATRLDAKKHFCPYVCMRIASESQQNRPVFEADEKWVTYDNVKCKRSQTVAKPGLMAKKVLLCVWWYWQGIIHYELLPYGQTLNSDLYCQQLDRLNAALMQKRPSLINRGRIVFD